MGVDASLTSFRDSIDKSIFEIFILAGWVPEETVDSVSEQSLKDCIIKKSNIEENEYDLAYLEKHLSGISMDRSVKNLESRVWKLAVKYSTVLNQLGYSKFIERRPKIAVEHILSKINDDKLKKRVDILSLIHI